MMKRRNFLKKLAQVTAATSFVAADAKAFGLFTTSFLKKRPAAAAWLTQANTIDYFGGGGLADSPIGIGARVCRMGNGTVGMFAGLSGNSSQVNAYVTGAANGPFTINGSYTPAATYADSVGDQLEVECVKSTVTNQYYTIWSTGNSTYGHQRDRLQRPGHSLHLQGVFGGAIHPAAQYPQCHHRRLGGGGHGGQCNCLVGQCLSQRRQFQRQLVFVEPHHGAFHRVG